MSPRFRVADARTEGASEEDAAPADDSCESDDPDYDFKVALDGAKPLLVAALVSADRDAKDLASQATARLATLCRDDPELNLDPQLVVAWRPVDKRRQVVDRG